MPDQAAPPQSPSKAGTFFRRLVTTIILWTIILTALFSGHEWVSDGVFIVVIVFLALAGLAEFYDLAAKRGLAGFDLSA